MSNMGKGKTVALGVIVAILGTFLIFTFGDVFFSLANTAGSALNVTLTTAGYSSAGNLAITIVELMAYGIVLSPLGLALGLIYVGLKM